MSHHATPVIPLSPLLGDARVAAVRSAAKSLGMVLSAVLLVEESREAAPAGILVTEARDWAGPRYLQAGTVRFFLLTPPEWADVCAGHRSLGAGFEGPLTNIPPE